MFEKLHISIDVSKSILDGVQVFDFFYQDIESQFIDQFFLEF